MMKHILEAVHRHVLTAIALLSLFVGTSLSAQAVTSYNDVWGYEDNVTEEAYLVAIGVTQTDISEQYHTSFVDVTLTSALGRSSFGSAADESDIDDFPEAGDGGSPSELQGGESEARAEILLTVDENDIGDYEITSNHAVACPLSGLAPPIVRIFPVTSFRQTYAYRGTVADGMHWYSVDCIGPCTRTYQHNRYFNIFRGSYYVCQGINFLSMCIGRCRGAIFHEGCH